MSDTPVVNLAALEPLFAPWEEPDKHRVRATKRDFSCRDQDLSAEFPQQAC